MRTSQIVRTYSSPHNAIFTGRHTRTHRILFCWHNPNWFIRVPPCSRSLYQFWHHRSYTTPTFQYSTQNFSWAWHSKELVSPQTTLAWVLNSLSGCRSNQSKLTLHDWVCFMTPLPLCPSYPFIHFTFTFSFENVKHCPGVLFPILWISYSCVGLCTIILIFSRKKTHTYVEHFVPDDPAVTRNGKVFTCRHFYEADWLELALRHTVSVTHHVPYFLSAKPVFSTLIKMLYLHR